MAANHRVVLISKQTHGLMQVFDEKKFLATLDNVYSDPLTIDHKYLCHLNLVLAIGCCLATPEPDTQEAAIVDDVRSKYHDQSEVFYLNAKSSNSPFVGLEDGDTWSVQALLLMAAYTLFKSKRNTAYSLIGRHPDFFAVGPILDDVSRYGSTHSLFTRYASGGDPRHFPLGRARVSEKAVAIIIHHGSSFGYIFRSSRCH